MSFRKAATVAVAAVSMIATPALAQSASKLSVASAARSGATAKGEDLAGGSLIIAILATGFAVATWTSILGALFISFGEWQKARMEEGFLTAELGADAYGSYCRRVPMLIPFLRPT